MIVPPGSSRCSSLINAAGFMATRTFGASPGVVISWSEMWIWNAETPASVPAGARISAGNSGRVARSLPTSALTEVKRSPVSCMPSPESPAKRMITRSRSTASRVRSAVSDTVVLFLLGMSPCHTHGHLTAGSSSPRRRPVREDGDGRTTATCQLMGSNMNTDSYEAMLDKMGNGDGFIAALDQSGGSTPKALKLYGLGEDAYGDEAEMFDRIHEMRTRI